MKTLILFFFIFVLSINGLAFNNFGDTTKTETTKEIPVDISASEVIDNYISAIGGKEKLLAVNDRSTRMKAEMGGIKVDMSVYQKAPDKLYQVVSSPGFEQKVIFNGEKGYQESPMGVKELEGNELQLLKNESTIAMITDLDGYGVSISLIEISEINGKPAYKLQFTDNANNSWYHYFDSETFIKVRDEKEVSTEMGTFKSIIDYDDHREVEGILYPFKLKQSVAGQTIQFEVTSVKVNTGLNDNLFEKKEE